MMNRKRVLALSNCALDPTLGSGKTRLRWAEGLRKAGFAVDTLDAEQLISGVPKSLGVRFRLAIGARRKVSVSECALLECFGAEFGMLEKHWFRRQPRPLIVAHTDGLELLDAHLQGGSQATSLRQRLTRPAHRWLDWAAFRNADALVTGCETDIRFARANGLFRGSMPSI
jgi:hypothetical protein